MAKSFESPRDEVEKLDRVIRQYEGILRTAIDPNQQERAAGKLKTLKARRDQLLQTFDLGDVKREEEERDFFQDFPYLALARSLVGDEGESPDDEINALEIYLTCFEREFLVLLSERQLKLDFKYSLERDSFYHRFQELQRKMEDFLAELDRTQKGEHRQDYRNDAVKRNFKMRRSLAVDADKLFKSVAEFTNDLIEDVETEGFKCLNGRARVDFDQIEGRRHLQNVMVVDALKQTRGFANEVAAFLNIPQFEES